MAAAGIDLLPPPIALYMIEQVRLVDDLTAEVGQLRMGGDKLVIRGKSSASLGPALVEALTGPTPPSPYTIARNAAVANHYDNHAGEMGECVKLRCRQYLAREEPS